MNVLDLIILVAVVFAAWGGYRLGLVARATSWFGMALGLFLAARLVPVVARELEDANPARLFLIAAGLLVGGAFVGQAVGLVLGARLHYALPVGGARQVDRFAGAALGLLGVAVVVWLLAPAMAQVPGTSARLARNSSIARAVADLLPTPPNALQTLEDIVGTDLPAVLDAFEPAPDLGPPPAESGLTAEVQGAVARSTVKVEAQACGRIQDGSGSVVGGEDLVVTNAHVVAGAESVSVQRYDDGAVVDATVVAFDPARDLAVLSVPDLNRPTLPMGDAEESSVGAVFGYPGGGDLEVSPYSVGREVTATGRDIYDNGDIERQVFFLSAELRPGDSGGALVDPSGSVVGVAFAIAPDDPGVAYALTIEELQAVLGGPLQETSAGPCL